MFFKFAALTAVAAATPREEIENSMDMWKAKINQHDMENIERRAQRLEYTTNRYLGGPNVQRSGHEFAKDIDALVKTPEFFALAKYIEELETGRYSQELYKFRNDIRNQAWRVKWAKQNMEEQIEGDTKYTVSGHGIHDVEFDVDNEYWAQYNYEVYKLEQLNYKGMHEIPELVMLRSKVTGVIKTAEFMEIKDDWKKTTKDKLHQYVVKEQADLLLQMVKAFHITEADKKYVDPKNSPVVYDVMHAIYMYFKAVGNGDLQPILDFVVDGEYDKDFKNSVGTPPKKPEYPYGKNDKKNGHRPHVMDFENLYLF